MVRAATRSAAFACAVLVGLTAGTAQAEPKTIDWADLRQDRPATCAQFLADYLRQPDCAQQVLVSRLVPQRLMACTPGVAALEGQRITIAGYAHPLEFEFRDVQAFLLSPALRGDCRHPPPPLPDQVVSVHFPKGTDINADPVWVTGRLQIELTENAMAPSRYVLRAEDVRPAFIPDVGEGG